MSERGKQQAFALRRSRWGVGFGSMARDSWRRLAVLLAVASLAVHHLRYLIAFGEGSGEQLAGRGHAYLLVVAPLAVAVFAAVVAQLLLRTIAAAPRERELSRPLGLVGSTLACAGAVLAIYVGQETLEGLLAPGHAGGWAGVFADGGWIAVPLAAATGLPVALAFRAGDGALSSRIALALPAARRAADRQLTPRPPFVRQPDPLAAGLAGRAPPLPA